MAPQRLLPLYLLISLYGLAPDKRGLVRLPHIPIWSFPENYNERLDMLLKEYRPSF
jgi:hypothetical protein